MAAWYKNSQDNYTVPGVGMAANYNTPHTRVNAKNPAAKQTLFDGAVEGQVLLKNTNGALPLKTPELLSLFGYSAKVSAPRSRIMNAESLNGQLISVAFTGARHLHARRHW